MTDEPTRYYLLVYRLATRELDVTDLATDERAAADAYSLAERRHASDDGVEVLAVGADSLETVRKTHSHYFAGRVDDVWTSVEATLGAAVARAA